MWSPAGLDRHWVRAKFSVHRQSYSPCTAFAATEPRGQVESDGFYILYYTFNMCCVLSSSCVSHGSKLRVRVFTTASPESSKAASSSGLRRVGRLRPSSLSPDARPGGFHRDPGSGVRPDEQSLAT